MTGDRPPASAMILAAGLGTRMRPHSLDIPKVLVPVKGRPIIDYTVERLAQAGVKHAVVNAHHHADQLISHLAHLAPEAHLAPVGTPGSDCSAPVISISDERAELLDTGGGFAKALPILGDDPFYGLNGDVIWLDGVFNTLHRLTKRWDPDLMDALLLVVLCPRAVGYDGRGDFMMDGNGLIRRRREVEVAPYVYSGLQLLHPRLFARCPDGAFSLNLLYDRAISAKRLYGLCHDGLWLHVGTPDGLRAAEATLAAL